MSTYGPGTVAIATAGGIPGVRVMRVHGGIYSWRSIRTAYRDDEVTDIRPLIVLDLYNDHTVQDVCRVLEEGGYGNVVKQIEAQTKPPRMPEPGLWGVVRAPQPVSQIPVEWVHGPVNAEGNDWHSTTGNWHRVWSDLIDPTLVRPGIEDAS